MEERFWKRYRDRGLSVVALNPFDQPEQIGGVQRFVQKLGPTYDVGLETSGTYRALTQNFPGPNPFPTDVIVDQEGNIVYIAREYDPEAMTAVIERLLARE